MSRRGFTLLEMLISVTILALLITVAVRSFQGITQAEERARVGVGRGRAAHVLLDRIERELVGAVLVPRVEGAEAGEQPYLFTAEDGYEGDAPADTLRFVTRNPARSPGAPGGLRRVTYRTRPADDAEGLQLWRSEGPLELPLDPQAPPPPEDDGELVADHLAGFDLSLMDPASEAWLETWDSNALEQLDELPLEVRVGVELLERDAAGQARPGAPVVRQIPLPVRPAAFLPGGDGGCGLTASACWQQHVLPGADAGAVRELEPLYTAVPADACWNEDSQELAALKAALAERGINTSACQGDPGGGGGRRSPAADDDVAADAQASEDARESRRDLNPRVRARGFPSGGTP